VVQHERAPIGGTLAYGHASQDSLPLSNRCSQKGLPAARLRTTRHTPV
jgi:hypothetical protein